MEIQNKSTTWSFSYQQKAHSEEVENIFLQTLFLNIPGMLR